MMEFVIPVNRKDLVGTAMSSYAVSELVSVRNIPSAVQNCQRNIVRVGHQAILKQFDILYSALHEWKSIDACVKEETWHVVLKGCEVAVKELASVIKPQDPNSSLNRIENSEKRNAIKMHCYLLCQLIEIIENDLSTDTAALTAVKTGRSRGKAASSAVKNRKTGAELSLDWPSECSNALTVFDQLCKLDIRQFWDPPIVEEDFVNLLGNGCYKVLENKTLSANVAVRTAITSLLGTLVSRYKHGITCSLKLAQMLQCFPHMEKVLGVIVDTFMAEESMVPFVKELINEICNFNSEDLERDATGTHNLCAFIESVSSAHPSLGTSILPLIRARLSEEPYLMRCCALKVIGEVLRNLFNNHAQIDGKDKIQRDRLMDVLQEHILDVNGYVRSRALHIWCNVASIGGLPITRQAKLIKMLVGPEGAIFDVSSLARRYAVRLLIIMITQSPAVKLNKDELATVLKREEDRLQVLEENLGHLNPEDCLLPPKPEPEAAESPRPNGDKVDDKPDDHKTPTQDIDVIEVGSSSDSHSDEEEEAKKVAEEQGLSEAAAALEAMVHSSAQASQDACRDAQLQQTPHSAEVAWEAQKADLMRQRACVVYLREIQLFAAYMATGIEDVRNLLHSKTTSDVLEAIEFFLIAKQAGVKNIDVALRHMLAMIWSPEEQIRKAVLDASRRLYFQPDMVNESFTEEGRLSSAALTVVISTLVQLVSDATMGDFVSLERILRELLELGHVDEDLKHELWRRFTDLAHSTASEPPSAERRQELKALLILLKMISSPSRKNLELHLSDLVNYGLGAATGYMNTDLECAMYTCMVIQQMIPTDKLEKQKDQTTRVSISGSQSQEPFRLPASHQLYTTLRKLLVSTFSSASRIHWIPLMEQAVATLFQLIETPSRLVAEIIREVCKQLLKSATNRAGGPTSSQPGEPEDAETALVEQKQESDQPAQTGPSTIPSFVLTRFLALIGHVALKMLVHLDHSILNELKRREAIQAERKQAKKRPPKSASRSVRPSAADTSAVSQRTGVNESATGNSAIEDESAALIGAVADDAEADYIRNVLNDIVLDADHLLARVLPVVVHVCSHPNRYSDPDLQAAASLSLVKFMLLSSVVCEENLRLLFTLAECSTSEVVRANLIVGLGDLARRFPNLIEPWTPNLYARLRDPSPKVRINALNTLSHLILNDMVKVKGQISEMTVCLVDENERLKQLSRLFFRELAQKGNALYNVMPDIISRLSDSEVGVDETKFRLTVDFLFPLIGKERLCETLVEKILARFRVTKGERHFRDLAYCLRAMSFNERMMRILQENLGCLTPLLHIPDVYQSIASIVENFKKNAKPELMPMLEEIEARISKSHEAGVEDEEAAQRAEVAKKVAAKRRRGAFTTDASTRRTRGPQHLEEEDGEEREAAEEEVDEAPRVQRKTRTAASRPRRRVARRIVFSSDDEDEDEAAEEPEPEEDEEEEE